MTVEIRAARPEELDAVGEMTAAAYVEDGLAGGDYAPVLRDAIARAAVAEVLVAVDAEGALLGTVTLVGPQAPEDWRGESARGAATIRMPAPRRSARGRGVGTALTRACIERARGEGWKE